MLVLSEVEMPVLSKIEMTPSHFYMVLFELYENHALRAVVIAFQRCLRCATAVMFFPTNKKSGKKVGGVIFNRYSALIAFPDRTSQQSL